MPEVRFEPARNGSKVFFHCPRCHRPVDVIGFDLEPVLMSEEDGWAEKWFFKAYGICSGCEWSGRRAVGSFRAVGSGRLAKESRDEE